MTLRIRNGSLKAFRLHANSSYVNLLLAKLLESSKAAESFCHLAAVLELPMYTKQLLNYFKNKL